MMGGDDQELRELRNKWPSMTEEEKKDTFLWKMVWFHHTKHVPGAPPHQAINRLADMIDTASKSSEKLTNSIRIATWVGGIAAAVAVVVAIIALFVK